MKAMLPDRDIFQCPICYTNFVERQCKFCEYLICQVCAKNKGILFDIILIIHVFNIPTYRKKYSLMSLMQEIIAAKPN